MKVMLDLETMGNGSNATIIAIGAVYFDKESVISKFYVNVDRKSCEDRGFVSDDSTIKWWSEQSDAARDALLVDPEDIIDALQMFRDWINDLGTPFKDVEMWGNGAMFDNTILGNAYKACSMQIPWSFWNDRCYRTVKSMNTSIKLNRVGTHHNAVDDAESQALHLINILKSK
tara:strand:+ start:5361 stop:5879 length:519 start_codon:yes stop_codon:yes gene_type:complete